MGAEPEQIQHGRLQRTGRPAGGQLDDQVVRPLPPAGARQQLGGERRIARGQPALVEESAEDEVRVRAVAVHRPQCVVREPPSPIRLPCPHRRDPPIRWISDLVRSVGSPDVGSPDVGSCCRCCDSGVRIHHSGSRASRAIQDRQDGHPPKRSSAVQEMPRAQSAAAIGFLPCGLTSPSTSDPSAVPDPECPLGHLDRAGRQVVAARREGGVDLEPLATEGRPGPGRRRTAADQPVDLVAGPGPVDGRVIDGDLGCDGDPVLRLRDRLEPARLDPVQGVDQQLGATDRQPAEQVARRVGRCDPLGVHREHRARVELLDDPERRRARVGVAGQHRVLHRRRAAPPRQHREVQVHPASGRDVERDLR